MHTDHKDKGKDPTLTSVDFYPTTLLKRSLPCQPINLDSRYTDTVHWYRYVCRHVACLLGSIEIVVGWNG